MTQTNPPEPAQTATAEQRLAAERMAKAGAKVEFEATRNRITLLPSSLAYFQMLLAADPTLICPDPEAHALADAVRRLPTRMSLYHAVDGTWTVVDDNGDVYDGADPIAAITAALEDKP